MNHRAPRVQPVRTLAVGSFLLLVWSLPGRAQPASHEPTLTRELLSTSLRLGTEFLLANQRPEGNFAYLYDWQRKEFSTDDNPVRQAGAAWGLATIYAFTPNETLRAALERALNFMNEHSRHTDAGQRYLVYPGEKIGSTGAVALVALAHLDYLRTPTIAQADRDVYRSHLDGYLKLLETLRRDDERWHAYYDVLTGKPFGGSSAYADGEALLALVKAVKYQNYDAWQGAVLSAARAGYELNVQQARQLAANSEITKAYYQWSSMAFYEIATSGWEDSEAFGDYVIELADWVIDDHGILQRRRNTAYAYEGILHAYQVAKSRQDAEHLGKYTKVIEQGLTRLTTWQIGSPTANSYVRQADPSDRHALGGVQNHHRDPQLRIDVTQHQMHAVILALTYYLPDN